MPLLLNCLYLAALAVSLPFWVFKAATTGKYRRGLWRKLRGVPPRNLDGRPVVWLHAVSVGEVLLLRPLLARLRAEHPDCQFVLSTTTNTGFDVAHEKYPEVATFYAPIDFTWAVGRVMQALQPRLLVLVELELWPNLLLEARRRNIPVAVVNARLSERSGRGYLRFRSLLRPALRAIHWWGAQSEAVAERIRRLIPGDEDRVSVTGSMKFDGAPTDRDNPRTNDLRRLLQITAGERVFVAGSTQGEEETYVLDAWQEARRSRGELRLVVVPRHPERFNQVADLLESRGIPYVRRSRLPTEASGEKPVILVDTVGELAAVWGLADYGFVGGSLRCGRGGQSMIEPAGYGVALCFGPETWNFQFVVDKLIEADAAIRLSTPEELPSVLSTWMDRPDRAAALGDNARRFIASQVGAVDETVRALAGFLPLQRLRHSA